MNKCIKNRVHFHQDGSDVLHELFSGPQSANEKTEIMISEGRAFREYQEYPEHKIENGECIQCGIPEIHIDRF